MEFLISGFWTLFPHDWQRVQVSTFYRGQPTSPVISLRIIDKSGNEFHMDSPAPQFAHFLEIQFLHLRNLDRELRTNSRPGIFQIMGERIKKIKEYMDEIATTSSKSDSQ